MKQFAICLGVFVVECCGSVYCGWKCSVGYTGFGSPYNVCGVPVIPVCILLFLP